MKVLRIHFSFIFSTPIFSYVTLPHLTLPYLTLPYLTLPFLLLCLISFLAISAWNDNGLRNLVQDPKALYRSDFFPGLGWMLNKSVWEVQTELFVTARVV